MTAHRTASPTSNLTATLTLVVPPVVSHVLVPTVATGVMNTVGGVASVVAVMLDGPLIALMTNMASAVLAVSACEASSDVLSFPQALIPGVRVGSDDAAASRGVTLVNTVLTAAIIGAFFAAGCVMAVVGGGGGGRATLLPNSREAKFFLRALTAARLPGSGLLVLSVSVQGTMAASVRLARTTASPGADAALIATAYAVVAVIFILNAVALTRAVKVGGVLRFTPAYVTIRGAGKGACGQCLERAARSRHLAWLLFGRAMWRTSRVTGSQDPSQLDPSATRVRMLFTALRGPKPQPHSTQLSFATHRFLVCAFKT